MKSLILFIYEEQQKTDNANGISTHIAMMKTITDRNYQEDPNFLLIKDDLVIKKLSKQQDVDKQQVGISKGADGLIYVYYTIKYKQKTEDYPIKSYLLISYFPNLKIHRVSVYDYNHNLMGDTALGKELKINTSRQSSLEEDFYIDYDNRYILCIVNTLNSVGIKTKTNE